MPLLQAAFEKNMQEDQEEEEAATRHKQWPLLKRLA